MKIFTFNHSRLIHIGSLVGKLRQKAKFLVLLVGLMFLMLGSFAQTTIPVTQPAVGFNIDGDLTAGGTPSNSGDWLSETVTTTTYNESTGVLPEKGFIFNVINPNNLPNVLPTSNVYNDHTLFVRDPYASNLDRVFTGSNKKSDGDPNSWRWEFNNSTGKTDINNAMFYLGTEPASSTNGNINKQWLIVGADGGAGSGSRYIDFEFYQYSIVDNNNFNGSYGTFTSAAPVDPVGSPGTIGGGGRTKNDFTLSITYSGNGTATIEFFVWEYTAKDGWHYENRTSTLNGLYSVRTNTGDIDAPYGAYGGYAYTAGQFVEAAINLTDLFAALDPCLWIKVTNILIKTKQAGGTGASLSDFVQPVIKSDIDLGAAISYDGPFCPTGGTVSVTQYGQKGGIYSATTISGGILPIDPDGTIHLIDVGTYSVTYSFPADPSGGCTLTRTTSTRVVINSLPTISGSEGLCVNSQITLTGSGTPAITNPWVSSAPGIATVNSTGVVNSVASGATTITYTNSNGCSETKLITVLAKPSTPLASNDGPICAGSTLTLNTPLVSGASYSWTGPNGFTSAEQNPSILNVTTAASGTYFVTVTVNGCASDAGNTNVTVLATPVITNPGAQTACDSYTLPTITGSNLVSAKYYNNSQALGGTVITGPITSTQTVWIYDATATSPNCSDEESFLVTINKTPVLSCPTNIFLNTESNKCSAVVTYTATTTGTPTPTITYTFTGATSGSGIGTGSGSTFNKGVTNVVITASNICADVTCSFTVTITDDQKPVIAKCAEARDIEGCSTAAITSPAYSAILASSSEAVFESSPNNGSASDNCSITSVTYIDVVSSPSCPVVVTRTWTLMDAAGNSTTCTQTINVNDTTSPTWTTSATNLNRTLSCEDESGLTNAQALVPVSNDACDVILTPVKTSGLFVSSGCGNAGSYTNTFKVTDTCGNISGTFTQVITVTDTKAPTWITGTSDLNRTLSCEDADGLTTAQALIPVASDNCDLTLTPVKTPGAFVQAGCGNAGSYTNTFIVTDDCSNSSSIFTQVITITDTKTPTWTTVASNLNRNLSCEDAVGLTAAQALVPVASDNCDVTLTPIKTSGLFISAGCGYSGSYTNTFKVTDDCGNTSGTFTQVITITDTKAPVITGTLGSTTIEGCTIEAAPKPVTTVADLIALGSPASPLSISDNCTPNDNLIVTSSDTSDGTCPIKIYRTYKVTDACGNSTTITSTYIIEVNDHTPPAISDVPGSITYSCASEVPAGQTASVTVDDNCLGQVSVTVTDVTTSGSCANKFTINRIWTAIDVCGNTTSATQIITVNDQSAPTITAIPLNLTVSCASEVPVANTSSVTATDNCSGTLSVTVSADVITNNNCANRYTISRTYWVADVCGNTSSATQIITVNDQIAPTISSIPADLTVSCASEAPVANTSSVTATDNCSGTVSITVSADVISNQTCDNRYTITRTYWATDVCGNTASKTQTILVDDQIAPTISSIPADLTVSCASEAPVANTSSVTATDNCSGTVSITVSADVISNQTCVNRYTISRTYWATDVCGNTTSATQTITVNDQIAPIISGVPASQTYSCASEVPTGQTASVTATDNCSGQVSITVTDETTSGDCANKYTIIRKWTATDECGNTSSATQSIIVDDQIAPTISGVPEAQTFSCASEVPSGQTTSVTVVDNCTGLVTVTVTDVTTSGACANKFTITRKWTATDICGNTSSTTQIITVDDQTPPMVLGSIQLSTVIGCSVTAAPAPVTNVAGLVALGLSISDGCTASATLTVTSTDTVSGACPIVVSRTYKITDACGNFSTYTQTINVTDNTAPVITGTISTANVEGCSSSAAPTPATTVAALESLGLNITDNCTPDGSLVVTSSQTSNGSCPMVITRTYRVTDICGNVSTAVQTISIVDNTAPLITGTLTAVTSDGCAVGGAPAPVTSVAALELLGLDISDNCSSDGALIVTSTETSIGTCPIVITRTYRIADACGNFITADQIIRVSDLTAPVISGTLTTTTVEGCAVGDATAPVTTATALENLGLSINDACTTDANLVVTSTQTSTGTCPIVITRTYKITDTCGNSSTATQTINVGDHTAPIAKCKDITVALKPDGTVTFLASDLDGGSTDNCSIKSVVASKTTFTCSELGAHTVTLTVTDNCGNFSTCNAVVTVTDPNPPSLSINDVEVVESAGKAVLTVTLANARACDVSFTVNTANNSALAPGDYSSVNSVVYTIAGGTTSVVVNVPITDDLLAEPTETFFVKLSNPVNGVIADDQGIVSITDDDSPPSVIIGDASANEGNTLSFPVSLSNVSSADITVIIGFTNITTSNGDYSTTLVTVSFPAGTTTATAIVPSIADYLEETNESFVAAITGTTGPVGDTSDTGKGTILDDDDKPIAVDDNLTTDEDIVLHGDVSVNDFPNAITGNIWSLLTQPAHGDVTMNTNGTFTYTPDLDYNGNDSFTYKLCDVEGDCDDATVFIAMKPVDDVPIANDETFTAHMDGVLDDFVDENDILSGDGGNSWSIVKQPTTGSVTLNSDGSFNYTPNVGYLGNDSFTYKLCDVDGDCDEAVVNIVVEDILPNQIFTPNGDGQNDTYYVKNIEFYQGSRLTVFNRWGNKVYQKTGYLNDWDGYSNMNIVGSKALPVGTYYYLIDYGINRHKTGFLYLER